MMALPPERITVKRRRDEDPVEALYIQSKKQRPAILWKLQGRHDDQHKFVQEVSSEATRKNAASAASNTFASSILPKSPERSHRTGNGDQSFSGPETPTIQIDVTASNETSESSEVGHDLPLSNKIKGPKTSSFRRFHLTPQSYPTLKRQPSFSQKIQKRQRSQRERLAIFVESERAEQFIERTIRERHGRNPDKAEKDQDSQDQEVEVGEKNASRKRPNVNAAEKAWRSENWGKHNVDSGTIKSEATSKAVTSWDADSMEIAQELQKFALEQACVESEAPPATKPKFQPKPPGQRHTAEGPSIPTADDKLDDDGDYIFDTYVRAQVQTLNVDAPSEAYVDPLDNMDSSRIGILVIQEDQETLWEEYGDEYHSEVDFETDEEDENAEDFYGNDYPEDEVDSDDEYGRGSYNYRKYGSDDEEYGDDEPAWSDDEHESFP